MQFKNGICLLFFYCSVLALQFLKYMEKTAARAVYTTGALQCMPLSRTAQYNGARARTALLCVLIKGIDW
jgi:hypothetical protein